MKTLRRADRFRKPEVKDHSGRKHALKRFGGGFEGALRGFGGPWESNVSDSIHPKLTGADDGERGKGRIKI